jgi:transcription antitermination factor NusG
MSLLAKGYDILLPTYDVVDRRRRGAVASKRALFPGYVFCKISSYQPLKIVTTPGVIGIVGFGRRPCPVPNHEIDAVRQLMGTTVERRPLAVLVSGCKVRIGSGPLNGIEGVLMSDLDKDWIVISIDLMHRSVAARIEKDTELLMLSGDVLRRTQRLGPQCESMPAVVSEQRSA